MMTYQSDWIPSSVSFPAPVQSYSNKILLFTVHVPRQLPLHSLHLSPFPPFTPPLAWVFVENISDIQSNTPRPAWASVEHSRTGDNTT